MAQMADHRQALPDGKWLDVNGVRTRYYDQGSGEAVVLIYGGNFGTSDSASSAYTWSSNLNALAKDFRVVCFDKLGQGFTDNPPDDDYTMRAVVRHAREFIGALKLPPVHLVHADGPRGPRPREIDHHRQQRNVEPGRRHQRGCPLTAAVPARHARMRAMGL
jgi:hypothetical protein